MPAFLKKCPLYVRHITPYVPGKPVPEVAREFGLDAAWIVKLASNENPLGMSEKAKAAISNAATDASRYPDPNGYDLKVALSQHYSIPVGWLTLGNGSQEILEFAARALVQPGQSIAYSQYAFIAYANAAQAAGAEHIVVPVDASMGHDLNATLAVIQEDTRIVYISNPSNPTGTFLSGADIEAFLARVPQHVVVVLDEAYTEYLPEPVQYDSIAWVGRFQNLLVTRTFSKAYGLAGLRIGFGIAQPALTDLLNRIRPTFNVNVMAQQAAVAALDDVGFLKMAADLNATGYCQLTQCFEALGLGYIPSYGNFVLVKVGDDDASGARVNRELLKLGVIVRPVANYGLPRWLRVSIGLPNENERFIGSLRSVLGAQ